ncbi:urate hydroxylase PuuD [Hydrogenophaga sp.]|uniref:urate hydroxylase PuuD n=1 Tax=Hydrogenophaga sp. TaxID=1904254 RepID=UPI00272FB3A6|nr:urate hydroxylase PuuD [Hydrogenophaga sp.]MDP2249481.1 urate hydroxylase PuuD [Hydrogenophaga sp.]MDP3107296.1 urate hydroxylase PuuD [Hydrogenophaga sp.]MDP3348096.1 urate hydroxylase PuuD [Hydrogenophaga sp.]MDZ4399679.1 urate hydroxylase PuuD [Hydrogenophaga sp.]
METYLLDWANLLLRWLHVIVAIAWIGSSFYFVFLDSSLTPPEDEQLKKDGVSGELWAVHGGGFYHPVKFAVSPPKLPEHLHWFYWESYSTWLSGFALFLISYLWSPSVYLIDPNVFVWSPAAAISGALAFLVVFWLLYDAICRTLGQSENGDAKVGALVLVLVCVAAWLATQLFAGRAAFLLMGAMIATAMSANVFFWIIPGQRTVVADIKAGLPVDPIHGKRGKQRSVHNTYFTLPVLFAMLSNHYSFTYNHPQNWLILIGMMFAGAAIRQFFVMRHGFKLGRNAHPWPYAAAGVVVLISLIVWLRPAPVQAVAVPDVVSYAQLKPVIEQRCVMCHGEALQSKNVRLDSPEALKQHAQTVYQQVVVTKLMPMNNATGLTEEERALFAQWFKGGSRVD